MTIDAILWTYRPLKTQGGRCRIALRIIFRGRTYYRKFDFAVMPAHWDAEKGRVKGRVEGAAAMNIAIGQKLVKAEAEKMALEQRGEIATPEKVFRAAFARESPGDFLHYLKGRQWDFDNVHTRLNYQRAYNGLREFRKKVFFDDVTKDLLRKYRDHLLRVKGHKPATAAKHLSTIRAAFTHARDVDEIVPETRDPFRKFEWPGGSEKKFRLGMDDVLLFADVALKGWEAKARDFFIFSFGCHGFRFTDFLLLRPQNVRDGILSYRMSKTGVGMEIELSKVAMAILERWGHGEEFLFNLTSNAEILRKGREKAPVAIEKMAEAKGMAVADATRKYMTHEFIYREGVRAETGSKNALVNKYLKRAAVSSGLPREISFHTARHTIADMLQASDMPLNVQARILGHKSYKTTEAFYARDLGKVQARTAFRGISPI